jgi:hypothetical protein
MLVVVAALAAACLGHAAAVDKDRLEGSLCGPFLSPLSESLWPSSLDFLGNMSVGWCCRNDF